VIAIRVLEKIHDLGETLNPLRACDEAAVDAYHQRGDTHAPRAGGHNAIIPGIIFARQA